MELSTDLWNYTSIIAADFYGSRHRSDCEKVVQGDAKITGLRRATMLHPLYNTTANSLGLQCTTASMPHDILEHV